MIDSSKNTGTCNSNQQIETNLSMILSTITTRRSTDIVRYDSLCPNRRDTSSFKKVNNDCTNDIVSNKKEQEQVQEKEVHKNNNDTMFEKDFIMKLSLADDTTTSTGTSTSTTGTSSSMNYHRSRSEKIMAQSLSDLMFFGKTDIHDNVNHRSMSFHTTTTTGNSTTDFVKPTLLRRNGTILK